MKKPKGNPSVTESLEEKVSGCVCEEKRKVDRMEEEKKKQTQGQ